MLIHYISQKRSATTLSSRIVRRGGSGNSGMINNHLQRRRRRSVSITLHSPRPLPPSLPLSGVGFGQNYLEFFDSHPILHTWRWCSTLHRFVAWHLIRGRSESSNPRCCTSALWTGLLYAWENAFLEAKNGTGPDPHA